MKSGGITIIKLFLLASLKAVKQNEVKKWRILAKNVNRHL